MSILPWLLCDVFEQVGSITVKLLSSGTKGINVELHIFHINLFSVSFRLAVSRMVFFISIYQVNTLFKVKVLKPTYRRYISR